jgi:hypothetical protein
MHHRVWPIVMLAVIFGGGSTAVGAQCVARAGVGQAEAASVLAQLRDRCGCCPANGRQRCARAVVRQAVKSGDVPRACAVVAKRSFVSFCRDNEQVACVAMGGCVDTIGQACTGQPCRLGGGDCPASTQCSSACRGDGPALAWRATCGDPVCSTHRDHPGIAACTGEETAGASCSAPGATCDPGSPCNSLLVCTSDDPTHGGECPISRRAFKDDIRYLDDGDVRRLGDELMDFRLATWRYKDVPGDRRHLGFVIDDVEPSAAADRDRVDLYGYTSMAVAALQTQARRIDALEREVATLRAELDRHRARPGHIRSQRSSISSRSPIAARSVAISAASAPDSSRMSIDATSNQ